TEGRFAQTSLGHIPTQHLAPLPHAFPDPAAVAELFLGTPYLWGGNSRWGIDCSGLVQAAFLACGIPCPGDSDQQQAALGPRLPPQTPKQRGDLLFWRGHVAWVVDAQTLLHANAHHMAVAHEPIETAILRIAAQGDGPMTAHIRPEVPR
ncbi:MAG: C40 family peptidase, partial [Paracoccaceae bacterium]